MREPAESASRRAVLERQLDLHEPKARAVGVDRHRRLHAEAWREGEHGLQDLRPQSTLTGDRGTGLESRAAPDRPAREADRDPEATADAPRERGHGQVAVAALECLH